MAESSQMNFLDSGCENTMHLNFRIHPYGFAIGFQSRKVH